MKHITLPLLFCLYSTMFLMAVFLPSQRKAASTNCKKLSITSRRIYQKDIKDLELRELLTVIITNTRECDE